MQPVSKEVRLPRIGSRATLERSPKSLRGLVRGASGGGVSLLTVEELFPGDHFMLVGESMTGEETRLPCTVRGCERGGSAVAAYIVHADVDGSAIQASVLSATEIERLRAAILG